MKTSEEEKRNLQFQIVDGIDQNKIKIETLRLAYENKLSAMRLKLRRISKYAISQEAWYDYAVGSIIIFIAILIAFVVGSKIFR